MMRVFIGFDEAETVAYNVLQHSIQQRASFPVSIAPIRLRQVRDIFNRTRDPLQSTEFAFSRFLVPFLSDYEGWSVFMDCDSLVLGDIRELFAQRDYTKAVQVVKHDYEAIEGTKFRGRTQTAYPKKNWSSVILFNNAQCKALTPGYVETASGLELHQFKWLESDALIGDLPSEWNHLVGVNAPRDDAKLVHYTLGSPYLPGYADCEYASEWFAERESMMDWRKTA